MQRGRVLRGSCGHPSVVVTLACVSPARCVLDPYRAHPRNRADCCRGTGQGVPVIGLAGIRHVNTDSTERSAGGRTIRAQLGGSPLYPLGIALLLTAGVGPAHRTPDSRSPRHCA